MEGVTHATDSGAKGSSLIGLIMKTLIASLVAATALVFAAPATPSSGYPTWWVRQASCIRHHEWDPVQRWRSNTGNGFYGAYQFQLSTWNSHAPASWTNYPNEARPAQQTFVAWRTWQANGRRWGGSQWPLSSRACGVY